MANASKWPLVGWVGVALGVACGGGADQKSNFCLYEAATCSEPSSEIVGDTIINLPGDCPSGPSDFKTNCIDVGGSAQCPSLDATRTDSDNGDTFVTTQKNMRMVHGGTCDDWNANPGRFSGAGSAAPSSTSSPTPTGAAGSAGATVSGGGGGPPASTGTGGASTTGGGGAPSPANACTAKSTDTPCTTCFKTHCCDAFSACAANQSCLAIVQCAAKCSDNTCLQSCATGNDAGVDAFNAMSTCADSNCTSECAS